MKKVINGLLPTGSPPGVESIVFELLAKLKETMRENEVRLRGGSPVRMLPKNTPRLFPITPVATGNVIAAPSFTE